MQKGVTVDHTDDYPLKHNYHCKQFNRFESSYTSRFSEYPYTLIWVDSIFRGVQSNVHQMSHKKNRYFLDIEESIFISGLIHSYKDTGKS